MFTTMRLLVCKTTTKSRILLNEKRFGTIDDQGGFSQLFFKKRGETQKRLTKLRWETEQQQSVKKSNQGSCITS